MDNYPLLHERQVPSISRPRMLSATWGMFAAWLVHDFEEAATAPGWMMRNKSHLQRVYPSVPDSFWNRFDISPQRMYLAIGVIGIFMLATSWHGTRTEGRSWFFQMVLLGFGLHGVGHVIMSILAWGYTPGVITSPIVVIPFTVWAWRAMGYGAVRSQQVLPAIALLPPVILGAHAIAFIVLKITR